MSRALYSLVCVALLATGIPAQQAPPAPATPTVLPHPPDAYAAEPAVTERFDTSYRYNADGTGTKLDTVVIHVRSEAAVRGLSILTIPYSSGTQRVEFVSVRVRKANGQVVATPGAEAQDRPTPMAQATPLYSDTHLAQLPVRGLAPGDRLEYQVRLTTTTPEVRDQFYGLESFGHGRVVLERSVELRVPASKYLQVLCPRHPAQVSEAGGERTFRWTGAQTAPSVSASATSSSPNESTDEGSPPVAWTTFHSWGEVGSWFRDLASAGVLASPEVQRKAGDLLFGSNSPRARTEAVYNFVSQQVRSINVPLGQGSWQPHPAAEVLANQFGDSKDKAALLVALLRAAHLPASFALLPGTREVDQAVPAPFWFTQAAVLAGAPGSPPGTGLWLDPMPEVAPPGVLDGPFRDRFALVVPAAGDAVLIRTPAELPFAAFTRFETTGQLTEGGALAAHVDLQTRGDDELHLRQTLRNLGQAQWDRLSRAIAQAYGLPGETGNTVVEAPEQTTGPLRLSFDLTSSRYSDWENFRIVPLEPVLNLPFADRKTSPERDIELGARRTETAVARLLLPGGFSADLPPAVHLHTDFADLDRTDRLDSSAKGVLLVSERTLILKQSRLPAARWPEYRSFLDQGLTGTPWVQVTSASAAKDRHPPAPGENNPRAAELVDSAGEAIAKGDWAEAAKTLDAAKAINPRQPFLWSSYGAVARGQGRLDDAVVSDRREWQAHPEEAAVSHQLALDLVSQGSTAEAMSVLGATLALNPRDERTTLQLGRLQAANDRAAAEKTLRSGLALAPESLSLKLALGSLLLQGGKRDEGSALLNAVATDSQDPQELNDAAFALAEAGLNLPLAEGASRRSIQLLNAGILRGEDRGHLDSALRRSAEFLAAWDTYGWILLKQGFATEAEPWLRAAWADGAGATSGQHLAQLLQKQGRSAEASAVLHPGSGHSAQGSRSGTRDASQVRGQPDSQLSSATPRFSFNKPPGTPFGMATFAIEASLNNPQLARFLTGDAALSGLETSVAKVDLHTAFPPGSPAHIIRVGQLSCGEGSTCTLVLLPLRKETLR